MASVYRSGSGTGGSSFNGGTQDYPGVPFSGWDFHQPYCEISNYNNPDEVRNCYLVSLNDLDGGKDYVRGKIADYIKDLVSLGVKGFRVDASKHMWPGDLEAIQVKTIFFRVNPIKL
jgi:alpha-amylase